MQPDLRSFDRIMINSSAGKDSQAMTDVIVEAADAAGVDRSRLVMFHADLGRVEWDGTKELAAEHAAHYGLRFISIARPQGDLLEHVVDRRRSLDAQAEAFERDGRHDEAAKKRAAPAWPSSTARWCTSDHKRGQGRKALTMLADEVRATGVDRPARILNCMGFRRQESPARAKKVAFKYDAGASGKGKVRQVSEWCPILEWSVDQVWARIRLAGTRHHPAYDAGMPRLSCSLCVLAGKDALVLAAQLRPEMAQEYLAVEQQVGSRFTDALSMADIIAAGQNAPRPERIEDWVA